MLEYDFMRNAFAAAGVATVVSGLVCYFLVLRGQTFASVTRSVMLASRERAVQS
jgi:ABC-type Mn2+/Zn2+ transport system permease subunit